MDDKEYKSKIDNLLAGYRAAEEINKDSLRNLTHEAAMEAVQRLFSVKIGYRNPSRSTYSGLVDFQRYLRKMIK